MSAANLTSADVARFRLAQQGLADPAQRDPLAVLSSWNVQDSPPGAALGAVLARTTADVPVDWLDDAIHDRSVVALYNPRTATSVVPAADAAAFATSFLPAGDDDASLGAMIGRALPEQEGDHGEAIGVAVDAVSDALDGCSLSRDDLHEALRARLPKPMLPWCEGCQSHHARRGLLVMAGLHGRLCMAGRAGRQPLFARTDQWLGAWDAPPREEAAADLVRRFVRAHGPTTTKAFADWSGLGTAHAEQVWASVAGELDEVRIDDDPAWILADDRRQLSESPVADGVRLLAPGDPLLLVRDRERLVAEPAIRKRLWTAIPTTGLILTEGSATALWKARKKGKRLEATVSTFAPTPHRPAQAALERLAPHRGCTSVSVDWT